MRIHALGMGASIVIGPPGTLTAGSVLFATGTNSIGEDNANFFWDNTNKRFEIGSGATQRIYQNAAKTIFALMSWSGTEFTLRTSAAQTLRLGPDGAGSVQIRTNSTVRWEVTSTGLLSPVADNTNSIGSSVLRVATINAARYDSGASTGFTGTVAPPLTITAVGGIVTNIA